MTLVIVWGTRPEAIKIGPVVAELRALSVQPHLISTGQHWDLLRGTPAETDLCDSQSLGLAANGNPWVWVKHAVPKLWMTLKELAPKLVVVQGDTASALAGARAAHAIRIPVAHVEAGVRSGNIEEPYPEEQFRREISRLADWHYTPTGITWNNLLQEGISAERIVLTGNPVVSALARYADMKPGPLMDHIALTMHRREWLERVDLSVFLGELAALCFDHPELKIIWPVHPAVRAKWPKLRDEPANLQCWSPLTYLAMIHLLGSAHGLITDSGGLVEEAATLGIPTAILRNHNDRPEAVDAGIARQFVPTDLKAPFDWIIHAHPRTPNPVYGLPDAASRIAHHLASLV